MKTLHYHGETSICFLTGGVGVVAPDSDFDVPEHLVDRFLSRPDVSDPSDPDGAAAVKRRAKRSAANQRTKRGTGPRPRRQVDDPPTSDDETELGSGSAQESDGDANETGSGI